MHHKDVQVGYIRKRKAIKGKAGRCNQDVLGDHALGVDVRFSISYILVPACLGGEIGLGIGFIMHYKDAC